VHFILIKPVFKDPLSYVTVFKDPLSYVTVFKDPLSYMTVFKDPLSYVTVFLHSFGKSHKASLTVIFFFLYLILTDSFLKK